MNQMYGAQAKLVELLTLAISKIWKQSLNSLIRMAFAVPTMCANSSGDAASGLAILLK